jgi:hypothetical protein
VRARVPGLALQGILLFLLVPLAIWLLLRQPLGPAPSAALGLAAILGHRLAARPWATKYADARCLWCGRLGASHAVEAGAAAPTAMPMRACSDAHAALAGRVLQFSCRYRVPVAVGILAPLSWLIAASLSEAAGRPVLPHDIDALVFRLAAAATMVVVSASSRLSERSLPPRPLAPRPPALHFLALLGVGPTLWIFRLVGAWWLIDGACRLLR